MIAVVRRNKDRDREVRRARYLRKRELERAQQRLYREANRERIRQQQRVYRAANRDALRAKQKAARDSEPEKHRQRDRARRNSPEDRAKAVEKTRRWVAANKERHLAWLRDYRRRKLLTDPAYKARLAMRRRFYMAIRNQVYDGWNIRSGEAVRLLGCTMAEFVLHIESLWLPGMDWSNWSRDGWHIDHIVPLSAFDLADESARATACHYTNLRPLWAKDNLAKGSKVTS
jgi:hypothetical protein